MSRHHDVAFPGESAEYREARDKLLDREIELRKQIEEVAALRRMLRRGRGRRPGSIPECLREIGRRDLPLLQQ
jgi:predicted dithiol-disulfide oxidoreductase (DUF899 family)